MGSNVLVDASMVPVSVILSDANRFIAETVDVATSVLVQKENFKKFSTYLENIAYLLNDLSKYAINSFEGLTNAVESLKLGLKVAKQLAVECRSRNKIYLLLCCRRITKQLEESSRNISLALGQIASGFSDVSSGTDDQLKKLGEIMFTAQYEVATTAEQILEKIELAIQEKNVDRQDANNLFALVAEFAGFSIEQPEVKTLLESFKKEIISITSRKDMVEVLQMEQIILLLEKADLATTPEERERRYLTKRNSLARCSHLLEPLQSFYCSITGEIMVDPVETSSGQTFERKAIERWLADANSLCPLTKVPLKKSALRPNRTLRQSIEEWKSRNTMITVVSTKSKIQSNDEQEILHSLEKLHNCCIESQVHREWIVMEAYIPILASLLRASNCEVRKYSLTILCILAEDCDENKERIAKEESGLELIVRSLARKVEESTRALKLILELSKCDEVRSLIGRIQGCILLVVTMSSGDDVQVAGYAQELLQNLSSLDQNVIQMARANYFEPMLQLLCSGSESTQLMMANTLSDIELTDLSRVWFFRNGALKPLLSLLLHNEIQMKSAAAKALRNLSSATQNGYQMIREGAVGPLLKLLFCHTLSCHSLRENVAVTIMHLAMSTNTQEADQVHVTFLESEEEIFKLFSLISLSGTDIQHSILCTFHALCVSPTGFSLRTKLRQISAVKVLVQLCGLDDDTIRADAVKLFYYLTEDSDDSTISEHVSESCTNNLVSIIATSDNEEEIAAATGIISHLLNDSQVSQHLLNDRALEVIFNCLTRKNYHSSHKNQIVEHAAGGLCRFTVSRNLEWQKKVAEACIIPVLVELVASGTPLAKKSAAISLKQLSESSLSLSTPIRKSGIFGCCFSAPGVRCLVHSGICSIESSFCLLEAKALSPLVLVLENTDMEAQETSLDAILTLIDGELLQNGSKVLDEANAIAPIIKLLGSTSSCLQEKALKALERILTVPACKVKYALATQMPLVDITQRGSGSMKSLAAKVLAHLNVLHEQSSFFDGGSNAFGRNSETKASRMNR